MRKIIPCAKWTKTIAFQNIIWKNNKKFQILITSENLHATGWSKASWSEKDTDRTSSLLKNSNHDGKISDSEPAKISQSHVSNKGNSISSTLQ